MNDQAIQYVELTLEAAKQQAGLLEALQRLERNRDFRKVILDGYFRDEPARLASLLAEPRLTTEQKADTLNSIKAVGELQQWFLKVRTFGDQAQKAIIDHEEELRILREQEDETE